MSHTQLTYHIIFASWCRERVINFEHERELYMFIFNYATKRGIRVWRIGGMPDHIHLLCDIPSKIAVSDFVRSLKTESSKFMTVNPHFPYWKKWAQGYACVSVDYSMKDARIKYIMNQKIHHAGKTFAEEYEEFIKSHGFSSDGQLLGDDTTE